MNNYDASEFKPRTFEPFVDGAEAKPPLIIRFRKPSDATELLRVMQEAIEKAALVGGSPVELIIPGDWRKPRAPVDELALEWLGLHTASHGCKDGTLVAEHLIGEGHGGQELSIGVAVDASSLDLVVHANGAPIASLQLNRDGCIEIMVSDREPTYLLGQLQLLQPWARQLIASARGTLERVEQWMGQGSDTLKTKVIHNELGVSDED